MNEGHSQSDLSLHTFKNFTNTSSTSKDLTENNKPKVSLPQKIVGQVTTRWFLIGICVILLVAFLVPGIGKKGGTIKSEITSKVAIGLIFFCSGFAIKTKTMINALKKWKLHLFCQVFSFGIFPALTYGLTRLLRLVDFNSQMLDGMIILACLPTTIASNVVMTSQAGGNDAASLFNSALGNSVGVFITPGILYLFFSDGDIFSQIPIGSLFLNLAITVIVPLLIGQANRLLYMHCMKQENERLNKGASLASQWLLLFVLFCIFCDVFSSDVEIQFLSILETLGIVIFLHVFIGAIDFALASPAFWGFTREDRIAAFFCGTQKTLALGAAIMDLFSGDPKYMLVTVPLVMYHPTQILASGIVIPIFKRWKQSDGHEPLLNVR